MDSSRICFFDRTKKPGALVTAFLLLVGVFCWTASPVFAHQTPGAIWTSLEDGSNVNGNIYDAKEDVYLNGGPVKDGAAGLDASDLPYVFQVTDPSGMTLLSSDKIKCRLFTVDATTGRIDAVVATGCEHATGTDVDSGATTIQLIPYDNTPNNGGEYKTWITRLSDLAIACGTDTTSVLEFGRTGPPAMRLSNCDGSFGFVGGHIKTDNYKVRESARLGSIACEKYYDANNNGVRDVGEEGIAGWPIKICRITNDGGNPGTIPLNNCATTCTGTLGMCSFVDLGAGTYRLREGLAEDMDSNPALLFDWIQTETTNPATSTVFIVDAIDNTGIFNADAMNGIHEALIAGNDVGPLRFGNVAFEFTPVGGGLTWGYWKTHTGTGETPANAPVDDVYLNPLGIDLGLSGGTHLDVESPQDADTVFAVDGNGGGDEPPWPSPQEIGELCSVFGDCRTAEFSHPADCNGDCHEQLVVQLLALKLNVLSGEFTGNELYLNPGDPNSGLTLNEIIAAADAALSDWFNGGAFDFHSLQSTIDTINNNANNGGVVFTQTILAAPPLSPEDQVFVGHTCP